MFKGGRTGRWLAAIAILAVLAGAATALAPRAPFDARRVADTETRLWFSRHSGEGAMIPAYMERMLREQYGIKPDHAREMARRMTMAARAFRGDAEDAPARALSRLNDAYLILWSTRGSSFDYQKAARAELRWWTSRRVEGPGSVDIVGGRIADLYRAIYRTDHPAITEAGRLRAEADALAEAGGLDADWHRIRTLLQRSYTALAEAVDQGDTTMGGGGP